VKTKSMETHGWTQRARVGQQKKTIKGVMTQRVTVLKARKMRQPREKVRCLDRRQWEKLKTRVEKGEKSGEHKDKRKFSVQGRKKTCA